MTSFKKIFQLAHSSSAPWGNEKFVINAHNADLSGKDTPFSGTNVDVFRTAMNASFLNVDGNFSWGRNDTGRPLYASQPLRPGSWNPDGRGFPSPGSIKEMFNPATTPRWFGTPMPTHAANDPSASYLATFQTIQDFEIIPAFGPEPSRRSSVPFGRGYTIAEYAQSPDWMKNVDDWRLYVNNGFNNKTLFKLISCCTLLFFSLKILARYK